MLWVPRYIRSSLLICLCTVKRNPGLLDVHSPGPLQRDSFTDDVDLESERHSYLYPATTVSQ